MPTKIRLQRRGKKGQPFYHIVIADGRAPRDGKFIEKIGSYNPLSKPAEINLDFDRAVQWLHNGAQPTDTVRSILSYKGVLYKAHLDKGVRKGAMTQDEAELKFDTWMKEKQEKILSHIKKTEEESRDQRKKRLEAETKVKEDRAKTLAAKRAAELKAMEAEAAGEEVAVEEPSGEATPEAKDAETEETSSEMTEEKAEEKPEETVADQSEDKTPEPAEPQPEEPEVDEPLAEEPKAEEPEAEEPKAEEPEAEEPKAEEAEEPSAEKNDEPSGELDEKKEKK